MAGLQLQTGALIRGSYAPLTPSAAQAPSSSGGTIGQAAFGLSGSGVPDRSTAGVGSVVTGAVALIALIALYWTLPR